jgi:hypothetical protein
MGILEALVYDHKLRMEKTKEKPLEVEYQLNSWGEIFPPFLGDREHSTAARFILRDYPFKLFSSSTPYEEIPQKLCLTFRTSGLTDDNSVTKEFAAFLSLVTRRRVFPVRLTRANGLPIENKIDFYSRLPVQEKQALKEIDPSEICSLLDNLRLLQEDVSNSFMLALRLYHSSIEIMYSGPDLSYLLLITALEAISSVVNKKYEPENLAEYLDTRYDGWRNISSCLAPDLESNLKKLLMKNEQFIFQKIVKFVSENIPEKFWSEKKDDAKSDYVYGLIGEKGEEFKHSDKEISEYEQIKKEDLEQTLRNVYRARSKLVHEGKKFPASITLGNPQFVTAEIFEEFSNNKQGESPIKTANSLPPLITFERLVSYCMVEFLKRYHG